MKIAIIGAGIAGLSASRFLRKRFPDLEVIEASPAHGGLAGSFEWHGITCDLAPHRLYTENAEILQEIATLVPLREMRRRSQIFIGGKWIGDPVNAVDIMWKFFPRSLGIAFSYLAAKFKAPLDEDNFDALCLNQFGTGLNEFFFKPYSEKLFGIPADQISAAWGRRKIRLSGIKDMIRRSSKLYFKTFHYPEEGGYGAICDALFAQVRDRVHLGTSLVGMEPGPDNAGYRCKLDCRGETREKSYDLVVSTLPVSMTARMLGSNLNLCFRSAKLLYLLIDKPRVTQNHWFYFADREHIINRVAEFKNFAPSGNGPPDKTVLCCEVTRVEDFSEMRAIEELGLLGTFTPEDVLDSLVIDVPWAYPIYDLHYETEFAKAETFFAKHPRIFHIGRHAQFAHRDVDEIYEAARDQAREVIAFADSIENGGCAPDGTPSGVSAPSQSWRLPRLRR